ncbi:MAG: HNH endonuclease [Paludibacteraceae bacterium]|nr:HNH endonuclease [Paludibacteraceae bacterium]
MEFIHTIPSTGEEVLLRRCNAPRYGNMQLYCASDGRFFSVSRRSVRQVQHRFPPAMQTPGRHCHNGKRGCDYPQMRNFGNKYCHILIYEAWIGPRIPGMQIDHLNGNVLDYRARNLEQVWPPENVRRSKRLQALRKMGMRTNDMPPEVAKNFFDMKEIDFQFFVNNYRVEAQDTNMDRDFTRHREF